MFLSSCIESTLMYFLPENQIGDAKGVLFLIFVALYAIIIAPLFEKIEYRRLLFDKILKR